jgi:hypothetical protein
VPPAAPGALADAIERVLHDEMLRTRLRGAASALATDFDIARAVARIEAAYRSVTAR